MANISKKTSSVKPVPKGYHTVTPFIIVKGAAQFIDFIKKAFNAYVQNADFFPSAKNKIYGERQLLYQDQILNQVQVKKTNKRFASIMRSEAKHNKI